MMACKASALLVLLAGASMAHAMATQMLGAAGEAAEAGPARPGAPAAPAAVSTAAAGDSKDPKIRQWAAWEELLSSSVIVPEPVAGANPPGSGSDLGIDDAALGGQYGLGLGAGGYGYGGQLAADVPEEAGGIMRRLLQEAASFAGAAGTPGAYGSSTAAHGPKSRSFHFATLAGDERETPVGDEQPLVIQAAQAAAALAAEEESKGEVVGAAPAAGDAAAAAASEEEPAAKPAVAGAGAAAAAAAASEEEPAAKPAVAGAGAGAEQPVVAQDGEAMAAFSGLKHATEPIPKAAMPSFNRVEYTADQLAEAEKLRAQELDEEELEDDATAWPASADLSSNAHKREGKEQEQEQQQQQQEEQEQEQTQGEQQVQEKVDAEAEAEPQKEPKQAAEQETEAEQEQEQQGRSKAITASAGIAAMQPNKDQQAEAQAADIEADPEAQAPGAEGDAEAKGAAQPAAATAEADSGASGEDKPQEAPRPLFSVMTRQQRQRMPAIGAGQVGTASVGVAQSGGRTTVPRLGGLRPRHATRRSIARARRHAQLALQQRQRQAAAAAAAGAVSVASVGAAGPSADDREPASLGASERPIQPFFFSARGARQQEAAAVPAHSSKEPQGVLRGFSRRLHLTREAALEAARRLHVL